MLCMWIPQDERETLEETVRKAVETADAADECAGRAFLAEALERAEDLAARGNPWGNHLVGLYSDALSLYNLAYSDADQPGKTAPPVQPQPRQAARV
jgi:hypothetical protein